MAVNSAKVNWGKIFGLAMTGGIVLATGLSVKSCVGFLLDESKIDSAKTDKELGITYELKSPNIFRITESGYTYTFNFATEHLAVRNSDERHYSFNEYASPKIIEDARAMACKIGQNSLGELNNLETDAKINVSESRQHVQHFVTNHCPKPAGGP